MAIDENYGGFGFGYSGLGIVLEESGRSLISSPLIPSVLLGATVISKLGNASQKESLLPKIVSGDLLLALAIDEHAVHQPNLVRTRAEASGDSFVLNGSKTFVLDGHVANKIIVTARTSGEDASESGISLFLVDADAEGLSVVRTMMVDSRNSANVTLTNVKVSGADKLGEIDTAYPLLDEALDVGRIGLAAEMLGSVQELFNRTLDYLKQREQFGVLIGSFQGLQHRAADMYSEIELCKSTVRAALSSLDDPEKTAKDKAIIASVAKAKLCDVFCHVSNEGVQLHGGVGMTDEFDIGFFMKRARVAQQFLGDSSFHRNRYASLLEF